MNGKLTQVIPSSTGPIGFLCILLLIGSQLADNQRLSAKVHQPTLALHSLSTTERMGNPNDDYIGESLSASLQSAKENSYRFIANGLKYATTKLCDNELVHELNDLNESIANTFQAIDQAQNSFGLAQENSLQHLKAAYSQRKSHPARSIMETNLANEQLKKMAEQNRLVSGKLNTIHTQLVKGEVLYQRILAECLLEDFKSIFGSGKTPIPVPEIPDDGLDEFPDEFFDGDDFPDPEIDFLLFEID